MNPFSVKTPETLSPQDIASLFIDVFSDFPRILYAEHTFIHGSRGTGKSMMLRYLEPSVQIAARKVQSVPELNYYAVHMPIKTPNYCLTELERLDGAPYWLLSEHFLILNAALQITNSLQMLAVDSASSNEEAISSFLIKVNQLIKDIGHDPIIIEQKSSGIEKLGQLNNFFTRERITSKKYINKLTFEKNLIPYEGSIFGYEDFFLPYIRLIKSLDFTPNGPIYLMIDDADNLPIRMQKIINGWVSYRSTNDLCLKISTQKKYKTWRTTQGMLIENSHDFSDIDISSVYTSKQFSHYYDRIEEIVTRRLEVAGLSGITPTEFFPTNSTQDLGLENIKAEIGKKWDEGIRISSRKADDIRRYAVSEYLKALARDKKTNLYSYAGFRSMVDISSGMIRFFLEPAARMYSEMMSTHDGSVIKNIPYTVQDNILKKWSEEYVLEEFDHLKKDETSETSSNLNKVEQVKRLINAFGECFQKKLVSSDSERQYISFMVTAAPSSNVQEVLDLAVEWGYLNVKSIGRKEGFGRNTLYSLNRRLAPYFKLDPSGYAHHMSVTPDHLALAIENPRAFVVERLKEEADKDSRTTTQESFNFGE
ncbi:hypothetical protein [Chitinibacter sp. S2-10]|uniref:ORC-CDC6 family AAA ATPase n=1 Tax=Chitinibacter sp. S2-10 TaxID=3373597 RepID=UPI003977AC38